MMRRLFLVAAVCAPFLATGQISPANVPLERTDKNSQLAHRQLLAKKSKGRIDLYFLGDSITRRWGATDYPQFLANWNKNFRGWNAADFGWGADKIENILWRIQNGELDGIEPKVIVLLAGTNNVGSHIPVEGIDAVVENVTKGSRTLLDLLQQKAPRATVILTGIFPRNDNMAVMPAVDRINENLAKMADGRRIRYLNINGKLADSNDKLYDGMLNATDKLHPMLSGYQAWADALNPMLEQLLGPRSKDDQAPPPTGDPSAK